MSSTASSSTSFGSVTVELDDSTYQIDLSKPDAAPLRAALERYVASRGEAANAGVTGQSASASPPSTDEWVEAIAVRLDSELHRLVHNDPSMTATDPAAVADRLLAAVPTRHDLDLLTGPFYDTTGLIKWLGVTRQALDARANTGSLLMCPLEDGTRVYPVWQFRNDGKMVPNLVKTLKILRVGAESPWTVATWLRTPLPEFDGLDAVTWLDRGGDPERVFAAAHEDSGQWAR